MTVSLEPGSTQLSSGQEMSFCWDFIQTPGQTTSQSPLKLRQCSHIETMKIRASLMKSNLSCKVLSPGQVFHKLSGGDK